MGPRSGKYIPEGVKIRIECSAEVEERDSFSAESLLEWVGMIVGYLGGCVRRRGIFCND